jgi:hypothetical protein
MLKVLVAVSCLISSVCCADSVAWPNSAVEVLFNNCKAALQKRGLDLPELRSEVCVCFVNRIKSVMSLDELRRADRKAVEMFADSSMIKCVDKTIERLEGGK